MTNYLLKTKYLYLLALLMSCSWNVNDYEDVSKEIQNKVSDLDSYWQKKRDTEKVQKVGHGWGEKHLSASMLELVNRGLTNNPSIESIYHKIQLVNGQKDLIDSYRWPRFDLTIGVDSQILGGLDGVGFGPTLNWEIDLFSKIANAVEAADQKAIASQVLYKQARESLAGMITKSWVVVSNRKKILEVTKKQHALNFDIYRNVLARYKVGSSPADDLALSKATLDRLGARIILAERAYRDSLRMLAFIIGDFPGISLTIPTDLKWQKIPREFDFAMTEDRYDVMAMQHKVAATVYAIDSAELEKFPSFKIGGFVGVSALGDFMKSYAVGVSQPLYRGGEISSKIEIEKAKYQMQLAQYRGLLLNVAREVERGFMNIKFIKNELDNLVESSKSYEKAYKLRFKRYKIGKMELQDLIILQQEWLSLELTLATREHQIVNESVDYFLALGSRFYSSNDKYPKIKISDKDID